MIFLTLYKILLDTEFIEYYNDDDNISKVYLFKVSQAIKKNGLHCIQYTKDSHMIIEKDDILYRIEFSEIMRYHKILDILK